MQFIQKHEVPHDKIVTYARFVCDYKPLKDKKEQTRLTVGGDILNYQGEVSTKTAGLTTINVLLNSVISLAYAIFMMADVKNFYLNTPMKDPEKCASPSNSSQIKYKNNTRKVNLSTTNMFMFK